MIRATLRLSAVALVALVTAHLTLKAALNVTLAIQNAPQQAAF